MNLHKNAWLVLLPAVVICSYLAAKVASLLIAGHFPDDVMIPVQGATMSYSQASVIEKSDYNLILKRNFFDPEDNPFDTKIPVPEVTEDQPPVVEDDDVDFSKMQAVKSSLKAELLGTASQGNGEDDRSTAVIKGDKETEIYWISKTPSFAAGVTLVRILDKRIEFINSNTRKLEYIEMGDVTKGPTPFNTTKDLSQKTMTRKVVESTAGGDIQQNEGKFQVPRSLINKAMADQNRMFNDIRITPYFQDGQAVGLKVLSVNTGSLYEKLGIKRGDILKNINGKTLDINSAMQLFNELKDETNFTLDIEREGSTKTQSYEVI